ncbi:unnamed protein product [Ixodes persulcatus]
MLPSSTKSAAYSLLLLTSREWVPRYPICTLQMKCLALRQRKRQSSAIRGTVSLKPCSSALGKDCSPRTSLQGASILPEGGGGGRTRHLRWRHPKDETMQEKGKDRALHSKRLFVQQTPMSAFF